MAQPANYVFLPWVRQGAAADIQTTDMTPNQDPFVSVTVKLGINSAAPDVQRQIRLYGPGDVIGIDPQQVVRTEPRSLSTDFEPNYFPAIEFDRPDFPWLFTPAKADDAGKLRPWLCLIVVRKQEGVTIRVDRNLPLPILEIKAPARPDRELPNLSESWAWAHAQVAGTQPQESALKSSLGGDPSLTVSRLLCPRRLDPLTDYVACVVPAFEQGRRAGLGQPVQRADEQPPIGLSPAWVISEGSPAEVTLPIYFQWEFRTGTGGDFESLVAQLKAREIPATVGKRPIDISDPGFSIEPPPPAGTTLGLEGALRVVGSKPDVWPDEVRRPFQTALQTIFARAWDTATKEDENHDPIVGPPVYGCWHAARHVVNVTAPPPLNWLDELNLDPRHRATAAFGTQVVQAEQEELMASAWEQLGEIQRVNQMKRQAQLGRAVGVVYHTRHLSQFSEDTLLKVLAPAQSRLVVEATTATDKRALLSQKISQSALPNTAVSAPLRRMTSTRGVVSARFTARAAAPVAFTARPTTVGTVATFATFSTLSTLATFATATFVTQQPTGLANINRVSEILPTTAAAIKDTVRAERITTSIDTTPQLSNFNVVPEGSKRTLLNFAAGADSPDAAMFRKVAKAHHEHLGELFPTVATALAPQFNLFGVNVKARLLQSVDPEKTITTRVLASLTSAHDTNQPKDPLDPIMDAPSFPQPMYEALRDLSQDFLLPSLEDVPANTVALLETNPQFVESFMVGLNAEMSSELLWRDFPTDQRGTYFRQFWDTSVGQAEVDLEPITNWGNNHLGANTPHTSGKLVLLIRGELLRRYPNSVIYAVRAVKTGGPLDVSRKPEDEKHPVFRGTLKPDITFVGFDLSENEALGKAPNDPNGWFFVIQQQPTEPRFGLDIADFTTPQPPPLTTWDDLNWRHFANTEDEFKALSHVPASKTFPEIDRVKWGKNSVHQAFITLQRPVRIAIHARQMIGKSTS
ncbi:MAG TPA: hypothetical protein VJS13_15210 [Pyrinomonadaceae bacterium]|nr:hypothetical protein [Pyrinomonadaceae bacterium]